MCLYNVPDKTVASHTFLADLVAVVLRLVVARLIIASWQGASDSVLTHLSALLLLQARRVLQPPPAHGHGAAATKLVTMSALSGGGAQQHGGAGRQVRGSGSCRHLCLPASAGDAAVPLGDFGCRQQCIC